MNQLDPGDVFGRQDRGLPKTSSVIMPLRWTIPSRTGTRAARAASILFDRCNHATAGVVVVGRRIRNIPRLVLLVVYGTGINRGRRRLVLVGGRSSVRMGAHISAPACEEIGEELASKNPRADVEPVVPRRTQEHGSPHQQLASRLVWLLQSRAGHGHL